MGIFVKSKITELNETDDRLKISSEDIAFGNLEEPAEVKKKLRVNTSNTKEQKDKKHYEGHRSRLKEKLLSQDAEKMNDYELIELLLTFSIPRSDVKPLAKELLKKYKSVKNIFLEDAASLASTKGIGKASVCFFKIVNEVCCRMAKDEMYEDMLLNTSEKVMYYCKLRMSNLHHEQFRVIFLNRKNKLLLDEVLQNGTIDKTAIFPRELVKRAIEIGAGAMILVHNHPSGDSTPSKADIEITHNIQKAAKLMEILLYDHIIIGKAKHFSMRANNLIQLI